VALGDSYAGITPRGKDAEAIQPGKREKQKEEK